MSVAKNHARVDIQLYVELPDEKLAQFSQPGFKAVACDVVNLFVAAVDMADVYEKLLPYTYETRVKVSGGNVQAARDGHLKGKQ